MSDATQATRPRRKVRDGVVVSDKMEKTVIVVVQVLKPHPLYKKVVRHTRRFKVHDEENTCGVGDRVVCGGVRGETPLRVGRYQPDERV